MHIVLLIDSFKGSLTSREAENAVSIAVRRRWPGCHVTCIPIADGGEGLIDAALSAVGGEAVTVDCYDPLMRRLQADYAVTADGTVVIETARAVGLSLLTPEERNPLITTTYGVGQLIGHALDHRWRRIVVGLGGSATNDGGTGLLMALGARLMDHDGNPIPIGCGAHLSRIAHIDMVGLHPALSECQITVACDVDSPLCGPRGATLTFARQKGASPDEIGILEDGMTHWAHLIELQTGINLNTVAGAGAAGGMGGCLMSLLGARMVSGFDMLVEMGHIAQRVAEADIVITGEGCADRQTLMGKVPYGVLRLARPHGVPVMLVAGRVTDEALMKSAGFRWVVQSTPPTMSTIDAMKTEIAAQNLVRAVTECLRTM